MSRLRQAHDPPIGSLAGISRLSNGLADLPLPALKCNQLQAESSKMSSRQLAEEAIRLLSHGDDQTNRHVFETLRSSSPNPDWLIEQVKNLLGFTPVGFSVNPAVWSQHDSLFLTHQSPSKVLDILEKCSDVESPNDALRVKKRERRKSSEKKHLDSRMVADQSKNIEYTKSLDSKQRKSRDEAPCNSMLPPKSASDMQTSDMPPSCQLESKLKLHDAVLYTGKQKAQHVKGRKYKVVENSALSNEGATSNVDASLLTKGQSASKEDARGPGRLVLRIKRITTPTKCRANLSDQLAFNRFVSLMASMMGGEECQNSEDAAGDETLIPVVLAPLSVVSELSLEVIKLRSLNILQQVPAASLCQLLCALNLHVKDSAELQLDSHESLSSSQESRLWRKVCLERLLRSSEAALICLNIITTPNVSKQVQLEEVIQTVVEFIRYHLRNTIYPEYDSVYSTAPKAGQGDEVQKKRAVKSAKKDMDPVYSKLCDVVGAVAELADEHCLPDATLLQISTLSVGAFFVENVSHLQLNCLKVIRAVFAHHENYRGLIIEEIFTSLSKLPMAKRNLRQYRLNDEKSIQMMTALVLQLVQSAVAIPESLAGNVLVASSQVQEDGPVDSSLLVVSSYDSAMKIAQKFLSTLVAKCGSKGDEVDYRPLLEYFIADLLAVLNLPEWPASELMLTVLGRILVNTFASDSCDVSLKHSALEHVGTVAASLRRDAVIGREQDIPLLEKALAKLNSDAVQGGVPPSPSELPESDLQLLQQGLLDYLMLKSKGDALFQMAGRLYLGQWMKDNLEQIDRCRNSSAISSADDDINISQEELLSTSIAEADALDQIDQRKKFLEGLMSRLKQNVVVKSDSRSLADEEAGAVIRYLSQRRPFSRSFRHYLKKILDVFPQTTSGLRAKAMKALSTIVAADPHVLAMRDVQAAVYGRLTDRATSVREAATELVGSFILSSPSLAANYYSMLADRLQDSGVSVRKRVIKVMRDICVKQPTFAKIPQMCALMIKRINDEEGIKDLVSKVFHELWFSHSKVTSSDAVLNTRVESILDAVIAADDMNGLWFEGLLQTLLKADADSKSSSVLQCCEEIVDLLVQKMIAVEQEVVCDGVNSTAGRKLQACSETLYVFAKCVPKFLVRHASHLLPYLSEKGTTSVDSTVVHFTALTLELVIPLIEAPSGTFLAGLEEALLQIMMSRGPSLVASSTKCLDAVVNRVTKNYQLVEQYYRQLLDFVQKCREECTVSAKKSDVCRSLYVLGLLCKHFDPVNMPSFKKNSQKIRDRVYRLLMQFTEEADGAVQLKALSGLGFLCRRYPELMAENEAQSLYSRILKCQDLPKLQCQVMDNLHEYFEEQVGKGVDAGFEISGQGKGSGKCQKEEKVKAIDWGDSDSGLSNRVAELFTPLIREAAFHASGTVRRSSIQTLSIILANGLVHPMQSFPYLIAMSTDCDSTVREKAERIVTTINSKHPHVVRTEAMLGFVKAFSYQSTISQTLARGLHVDADQCRALCSHLYSLIRVNRQNRRSFINLLIRSFQQVKKAELSYLLFVADSLTSFPYAVLDEPLFVIHVVDKVASSRASTLLELFNEVLVYGRSSDAVKNIEDIETADELQSSLPNLSWEKFGACVVSSHQCRLLFELKSHLKETFGFTEGKCRKYSPSEPAKVNEKPLTKRSAHVFEPRRVIQAVEQQHSGRPLLNKIDLLDQYLEFRQLAMSVESAGDEECAGSDGEAAATNDHPSQQASGQSAAAGKKRRRSSVNGSRTPSSNSKRQKTGTGSERKKQKKRRKSAVMSSDDEELDPDFSSR